MIRIDDMGMSEKSWTLHLHKAWWARQTQNSASSRSLLGGRHEMQEKRGAKSSHNLFLEHRLSRWSLPE
jgi:hypothetical protein